MVIERTFSEKLFEAYCSSNSINCERIPEGATCSPDYRLTIGDSTIAVEIKQIDRIEGFTLYGVHSGTPGEVIRNRIAESKKQLKAAAKNGEPAILLVYNAADPFQMWGTDEIDFKTAMYGELTVTFRDGEIADGPFHGGRARLQPALNTSFSAIGLIRRERIGASVCVYENAHAANPLPFAELPKCIRIRRVRFT